MDAMQARAQTWQRRLADQLASGLSIADWCRANGYCRQSFYRWQARLSQEASEASAAGFTEIHLTPPPAQGLSPQPPGSPPLRLWLIGGRELLVPMSMPAAWLAQLLGALERLPAAAGLESLQEPVLSLSKEGQP
jgi:hypothetical protein